MASKVDLVDEIAKNVEGITKITISTVLSAIPGAIAALFNAGAEEVKLAGVGVLKARYTPSRKMTNFLTGGDITTEERMRVTMKVSRNLADEVDIVIPGGKVKSAVGKKAAVPAPAKVAPAKVKPKTKK